MIITFLGTSAANAYPEAFCRCDHCQRARALGGPNLRKRSALLVNDDLLIDLGPDVMTASAIHHRPLIDVRYCLQTHAHADHLDATHFLSRSPEYDVVGAPRLHVYASSGTIREASRVLERDLDGASLADPDVGQRLNLAIHQIGAMHSFGVGPYRVTVKGREHLAHREVVSGGIGEVPRYRGDNRLEFGADRHQGALLTESGLRIASADK